MDDFLSAWQDGFTKQAIPGQGQVPVTQPALQPTRLPEAAPKVTAPVSAPTNDSQVVDPFTVVPQLRTDMGESIRRTKAADSMLSTFVQTVDANNAKKTKLIGAAADAKEGINSQIEGETNNFLTTAQPIFQRRVALANQQAVIAGMNPLKRALMGFVSNTYNSDWLAEQDKAAQGQLGAMAYNYQTLMGLHDNQIKTINSHLDNVTALDSATQDNMDQDVQLAMRGVGTIGQVVTSELAGLEADQNVLKTQALARQNVLDGLTHGQINTALAQARNSPNGIATINGVPLRMGELVQQGMDLSQKELSLQSAHLAIANQSAELADRHMANYVSKMTGPELQQAMARGGKLADGTVLNQEALTSAYVTQQQRQEAIGRQAAASASVGTYSSYLATIGAKSQALVTRSQQVFGQVPPELANQQRLLSAQLAQVGDTVRKGLASGAGPQVIQQQIPQLEAIYKKLQETTDDLAKRYGAGNPNTTATVSSWLSGSPLSPDTSVKSMVDMARTGLPPGMKLSGAAAATFQRVQAAVQAYDAGAGAGMNPMTQLQRHQSAAAGKVDQTLFNQVAGMMQSGYAGNATNQVIQSVPAMAAKVPGPNGGPHPFTQVRPEDYAGAIAHGDAEGYKFLAGKLGLNDPAAVKKIFDQGVSGAAWQSYKASHNGVGDAQYSEAARMLSAASTQATYFALDHSPSARPGFKPSQALFSLMTDPQYQSLVSQALHQQGGNASMGDAMIHSVAGSKYDMSLQGYFQGMAQGFGQYSQQQNNQAVSSAARLRNLNPVDAAKMVLGTYDGITPGDSAALLAQVKQVIANSPKYSQMPPADAIDSVITTTKFNDPQLEKVRQTAARSWHERRPMIYKGILGLLHESVDNPDLSGALSRLAGS